MGLSKSAQELMREMMEFERALVDLAADELDAYWSAKSDDRRTAKWSALGSWATLVKVISMLTGRLPDAIRADVQQRRRETGGPRFRIVK